MTLKEWKGLISVKEREVQKNRIYHEVIQEMLKQPMEEWQRERLLLESIKTHNRLTTKKSELVKLRIRFERLLALNMVDLSVFEVEDLDILEGGETGDDRNSCCRTGKCSTDSTEDKDDRSLSGRTEVQAVSVAAPAIIN